MGMGAANPWNKFRANQELINGGMGGRFGGDSGGGGLGSGSSGAGDRFNALLGNSGGVRDTAGGFGPSGGGSITPDMGSGSVPLNQRQAVVPETPVTPQGANQDPEFIKKLLALLGISQDSWGLEEWKNWASGLAGGQQGQGG